MFYFCNGDGWVWLGLVFCEYVVFEVMYVFGIFIMCVLVVVEIGEDIYCEIVLSGVVIICVVFSYICVGMFQVFVVWGD